MTDTHSHESEAPQASFAKFLLVAAMVAVFLLVAAAGLLFSVTGIGEPVK